RCYVDEWLPSCDAASALPSRAALPPQFFPLKTVDFVRGSTSNVGTPDAGGLSAIRLARCACHSHASRCWPWVRCGSSRIGSAPCRSKTGPDRRGAARRDPPRSRPSCAHPLRPPPTPAPPPTASPPPLLPP